MTRSLAELRSEIDGCDRELLEVLACTRGHHGHQVDNQADNHRKPRAIVGAGGISPDGVQIPRTE